ncbi:MAG: alpha/beta hydrolase [Pseudomonadales bacterium]|nr:alpha/beta hydrolase [Pseudomonadales bacterium]
MGINGVSRKLIGFILGIGLLCLQGCKTYQPTDEAITALKGSETVSVEETSIGIAFLPQDPSTLGFIFYPGANVLAGSYAPTALDLAEQGITTVIAKFPLNLAVITPNRADDIRSSLPDVQNWVVGGHSLGGVMAAQYLDENQDDSALTGLILFAAYPSNANDLSTTNFSALSLYGSEDNLTKPNDVISTTHLLPVGATLFEIEGGNHAQFGWYGEQDGDGTALISRALQQSQIMEQLISFFNDFE